MKTKKRTARETAKIVEETINDIQSVLRAAHVARNHVFFDNSLFKNGGVDKMVKDLCWENKIKESHVRKVAGWPKSFFVN